MKRKVLLILCLTVSFSLMGCQKSTPEVTTMVEAEKTEEPNEVVPEEASPQPQATEAPKENEEPEITTGENIIPGGDFSESNSAWGTYCESGGSLSTSVSGGVMKVKIASAGFVAHAAQVYCDKFELLQNANYEFSFDISSTIDRTMDWRIQLNGGDYHAYTGEQDIEIGPDTKHITYEFTMTEGSDPAPRLCFNLGDKDASQGLEAHEITLDNVSLVIKDASAASNITIDKGEVDINLNQVGYRTKDEKIAVFRNISDGNFDIIDTITGKVEFSGKIEGSYAASDANETVSYGDFSDFSKAGTYEIETASGAESYPFTIDDNVYADSFDSICKMLYLQRCGMELTPDLAEDFAHPSCHTEKATIYGTSEKIDVSGGWHDAGDFGRYVAPGAKAVADILLAYENYPNAFSDNVGIPESGNGCADILDEARYELEWMLKMQAKDGGVYHKVTGKNFEPTEIMPQDVHDELFILLVSTTATGDFAAAMAMAARVYKNIDASFASTCEAAAKKALEYHTAHLGERNYQNPSDVATGEYADTSAKDEYLWALCELYKTTGDDKYQDMITSFDLGSLSGSGLGWQTVDLYACYAYLTANNTDANKKIQMLDRLNNCASTINDNIASDGYHSSIKGDYPWGSNMTIANNGMILLFLDQINHTTTGKEAAKKQLDYLLGNNSVSYCFVTGFGGHSAKEPHHRPSMYLKKAMPGMLIGGPNSSLEDPFAQAVLQNTPNAKCYVDNNQSYSCNEITIYWNSPLIYLMAGIME